MNAYISRHHRGHGFTIVELLVVITALSILVSLVIFFIGDWRGRTAQNEVKSSLQNAVAAMENSRNFGNGYPAALPSEYIPSQNVSVQLLSSTQTAFCLKGWSTIRTDIQYYVTNQTPVSTTACS
jgi:prepilin-type N-terminal cleavage/methylation domain-containing protein